MKYLNFVLQITCIALLGFAVARCDSRKDLESEVKTSEPFFMSGKQWHCALTAEQVDVDIKQDELNKLLGKRNGLSK